MDNVYLSHNNIVSSLGFNSDSVIDNIEKGNCGLSVYEDKKVLHVPFCSSRINQNELQKKYKDLNPKSEHTRLEKMMLVSLSDTISKSNLALDERTGLIISTTKGNIDVLEEDSSFPESRAYLSELGDQIQVFFGFKDKAIIVSNACVSGILAVAVAKRMIRQGKYDRIFIVAGDMVTQFILSGFNAFQALSLEPCRPYCNSRTGINIGEVAASVLVTKDPIELAQESVQIIGEASCNDANHISGPSRTGEGLFRCIENAVQQSGIEKKDIDYISGHGTATMFNDEMESIAFDRAGLSKTPLNSLKSYFGHTLGASGLLESIIGIHSLHKNTLFASLGFQDLGVSRPMNIIKKTTEKNINTFLKTASGFGGSNTAVLFKKVQ
ncbi:beta-ketoacyl synthase N-terminal-like domain-containing protein [Maribacter sp. PR1]|uniref:Beta-ketoacyl synthase N-terminal-like domain-containing protein n=1 Tax=Maribacter cobaltidurans TaxID=1178778 RepID=A0ABU7IPZ0_9FLAO|nr:MULTISPECIES: beta-ketoacyl synthase N-terminal-like domain-containing protein [Maribacter]MDC6387635.1 beta-ketoacyl synthase N-terminal-like domain-containing protein [Maribacter sp. PR1]MEE1975023.1 beta-ketoacyl synthase N-terminal-like domain-containing protein [Maribacter cobaltidurans]